MSYQDHGPLEGQVSHKRIGPLHLWKCQSCGEGASCWGDTPTCPNCGAPTAAPDGVEYGTRVDEKAGVIYLYASREQAEKVASITHDDVVVIRDAAQHDRNQRTLAALAAVDVESLKRMRDTLSSSMNSRWYDAVNSVLAILDAARTAAEPRNSKSLPEQKNSQRTLEDSKLATDLWNTEPEAPNA